MTTRKPRKPLEIETGTGIIRLLDYQASIMLRPADLPEGLPEELRPRPILTIDLIALGPYEIISHTPTNQ